ncbi:uncharacterized protein LOC131887021 [Tigriopus californicus]|uniref:uncharacterized protein LOC131887021 n=1 Tax=Tigriopus californicus TaxID=6832 RepID=UPI0027DA46CB|nr:uncharacterized protein LOC131887021 [Tigriopus californicus]
MRPHNGGWFSRSFDTRFIHVSHGVGDDPQQVELIVRHMYVFRQSRAYFTLWNKIVLRLAGPPGEEKIVGIQEHWFGVPLSESPFQTGFRRINGWFSALIGCGVDRFLYIKYMLSWDAR